MILRSEIHFKISIDHDHFDSVLRSHVQDGMVIQYVERSYTEPFSSADRSSCLVTKCNLPYSLEHAKTNFDGHRSLVTVSAKVAKVEA